MSPAEAAMLALRDEIRAPIPQTFLERGWAAVQLQELRRKAGLSTSIREMVEATKWRRGTLHNAIRIGRSLPQSLVQAVADELDVSLDRLVSIPQRPLLLVVENGGDAPKTLFRAAAKAYLAKENSTEAVRALLGLQQEEGAERYSAESATPHQAVTDVIVRDDGRIQLAEKVQRPLAPSEARDLANALREGAEQQRPRCPTGVHPVQSLDTVQQRIRRVSRQFRQTVARIVSWVRSYVRL